MERCIIVGLGYVNILRAVAKFLMSALDIVVDNCAICRNHIMDLCAYIFTLS